MATPRLNITEIAVGQTFKEVAHNEALKVVDALLAGKVLTRTNTAPPGGEVDGDLHIVAATATGLWAGQEGKLAHLYASAWNFYTPKTGMSLWSDEDSRYVYYNGSAWVPQGSVRAVLSMTDANYTATLAEASADIIEATGTLTVARNVQITLNVHQFTAFNNSTGGFGVQFIGPSGTGITVAAGKSAILYCDGTNVVRVTADL